MKNQNNNYEIVDLILPETFDKEKTKRELNEYFLSQFSDEMNIVDILTQYARDYIEEIDKIEKISIPVREYSVEYWKNVGILNADNFNKVGISIRLCANNQICFLQRNTGERTSPSKRTNTDLLNEQYKRLQKIYYSRLEENNERL